MELSINQASFSLLRVGEPWPMGMSEGFVKVLAKPDSGRILGVHIVGPHASELIAEATTVISFDGSVHDLAVTCHAHPTLSEVFREAALAVNKEAIHA